MRSLKTTGGMTRGRGMTDVQRSVWLLSTPICAEINQAMQLLTGVNYETSEQHKETTKARFTRDYNDAKIVMKYALERNPFDNNQKDLINLQTGEVAETNVNVDNAKNIGKLISETMKGKEVTEYSFKRKDQAVTIKAGSTVKIDGNVVPVDPQLLFQRLITTVQLGSEDDLDSAFSYELCTVLPALVDTDGLLRAANKPQLADAIWALNSHKEVSIPENVRYVLDGGSLLHKVIWGKGITYGTICQRYISFIVKHYGKGTISVFDGYDGNPST